MSKEIEKVLNSNPYVDEYEILLDKNGNYKVTIDFLDLRDSGDTAELLKLKNKIRSVVNRTFKIELIFSVTM